MERRTYIYLATPLLVFLSCGRLLEAQLGATWALVVAAALILPTWGIVWARLYRAQMLRPEFAVLSILPHSIYFISKQADTALFAQSPACQNLYALTWLAFAGVSMASVSTGRGDTPARRPLQDPVFLLLGFLILIYTVTTFFQYYTDLTSL